MPVDTYILNATNVHISINQQWVDEAVSVVAQRQASHRMVYGYMDVDARRPTRGNAIVVGTIGIHHRSADYIQRYLSNRTGGKRGEARNRSIDKIRETIKSFKTNAELLAYMASVDLTSEEFELLSEAVEQNAGNAPSNFRQAGEPTADPVGESGFKASIKEEAYAHPTLNQRKYVGNTIQIYYGDDQNQQFGEQILGVIFTGEALSPIENTAGVSADPIMKYYSFIGARIDPIPRDLSGRTIRK